MLTTSDGGASSSPVFVVMTRKKYSVPAVRPLVIGCETVAPPDFVAVPVGVAHPAVVFAVLHCTL